MCDENIEYRKCINCEESKELNVKNFEFRKNRGTFRTTCRECGNAYARKWGKQKREKNKDLPKKVRANIKNPIVECSHCGKEKRHHNLNFRVINGEVTNQCRECFDPKSNPRGNKPLYHVDKDGYLICYDCEERKLFNEEFFTTHRGELIHWCRKCSNAYANERRFQNRDAANARCKQYALDHKEELKEKKKKYYEENKEEILRKDKIRRDKNKGEISRKRKTPEHKAKMATLKRERCQTDIDYKIKCLLRTRVYQAIKNQKGFKWGGSEQLLGIPYGELMSYLEFHFEKGMTKENHGNKKGQWSLEHVICCESFDLQDESHQRKCFHYSNLIPMWHEDNMAKSDWITYNGQRIRARTLTKQQKHAYISSLNLPPYDVPNHSAAPYNPLINQIKLDLPIQTFINQEVNNPTILATNLPIRAPIIRRVDLVG